MPTQSIQKTLEKLIDRGKFWDNAGHQTVIKALDAVYSNKSASYMERISFVLDNVLKPELVTGIDPAANTEIGDTVPAGETWLLHSILTSLTTDANIADRTIRLSFTDGTEFEFYADATVQTATQITTRQWKPINNETVAGLTRVFDLNSNLVLAPGTVISTTTTNLQATDNWAAPLYYVTKLSGATPSVFRLLVDNSPFIEDIIVYRSTELILEYESNEFPLAKGQRLKFERVSGEDTARVIYLIKNAQLADKHSSPEEYTLD